MEVIIVKDEIILNAKREPEIWVPVDIDKRIRPIYFVSSWGRVKNNRGKIMSPFTDKDGYHKYSLQSVITSKKIKKFEHVLVAYHFIPNDDPESKCEVNHKNFHKSYNYYKNLEWVTPKYNKQHAYRNKRQEYVTCDKHGMASFDNAYVENICKLLSKHKRICDVLKILGFDKHRNKLDYERMRGKIKHIKHRHTWKPISSKYDF